MLGYEAGAAALGTFSPKDRPCCTGGGGGGGGARLAFYFLTPPNPEVGRASLLALRTGAGAEVYYLAISPPGTNDPSISATVIQLPAAVGLMAGTGHFDGEGKWRGVVLGLDWHPTLTHTTVRWKGQSSSSTDPNLAGVRLTLDVLSMDGVIDRLTPEPHFRASVIALPPVGHLPLYMSLGVGAAWY